MPSWGFAVQTPAAAHAACTSRGFCHRQGCELTWLIFRGQHVVPDAGQAGSGEHPSDGVEAALCPEPDHQGGEGLEGWGGKAAAKAGEELADRTG